MPLEEYVQALADLRAAQAQTKQVLNDIQRYGYLGPDGHLRLKQVFLVERLARERFQLAEHRLRTGIKPAQ